MDKLEALENLKRILEGVNVINTKVTSVSKSGMSRTIIFLIIKNNSIVDISYMIALTKIAGARLNKYNECSVPGAGMDIGFHTVESLSKTLGIELKQERL